MSDQVIIKHKLSESKDKYLRSRSE